jgi:hypothetical protein
MEKNVETRLRLEHPSYEHEKEVTEYVKEHFEIDENIIHGINELHVIQEYGEWI